MPPILKAVFNGKTIAQSSDYVMLEGNAYFPPSSLDKQYLVTSTHTTNCPYKGIANYYDVCVDGKVLNHS